MHDAHSAPEIATFYTWCSELGARASFNNPDLQVRGVRKNDPGIRKLDEPFFEDGPFDTRNRLSATAGSSQHVDWHLGHAKGRRWRRAIQLWPQRTQERFGSSAITVQDA